MDRGDIAAGMPTGVHGYTLPVSQLSPRVYLEFDYVSGDDRPGARSERSIKFSSKTGKDKDSDIYYVAIQYTFGALDRRRLTRARPG